MDTKRCIDCKLMKPVTEYYIARGRPDGLTQLCKPCAIKRASDYQRLHPPKSRIGTPKVKRNKEATPYYELHKKRKEIPDRRIYNKDRQIQWFYGLAEGDFYGLVMEQEGQCAICGCDFGMNLCLDHDHETMVVRGLLCSHCNTAIGLMCDSPASLRAAATYLETHDTGLVAKWDRTKRKSKKVASVLQT